MKSGAYVQDENCSIILPRKGVGKRVGWMGGGRGRREQEGGKMQGMRQDRKGGKGCGAGGFAGGLQEHKGRDVTEGIIVGWVGKSGHATKKHHVQSKQDCSTSHSIPAPARGNR